MGFWVALLVNAGLFLLGSFFRPRPPRSRIPNPSPFQGIDSATCREGGILPVVFGTCHVRGPNLTAIIGYRIQPARKDGEPTGLYERWVDLLFGICSGPVDEVLEVRIDGKKPRQTIDDTGLPEFRRFTVDDDRFFGGVDQEGGVKGRCDVYLGSETQGVSPFLDSRKTRVQVFGVPAFRGVCYAVLENFFVGNSGYLKPFSWIVRSCPNEIGLTDGKHEIFGDANPACILWALHVRQRHQGGLGRDPATLDQAAFVAAGETLHAEGLGMSLLVDYETTIEDLIEDICRHIDAVTFRDPESGLRTIRLARGGYDVGTLPVLDDSNCEVLEFKRPLWNEVTTSAAVEYVSRAHDYAPRTTGRLQDPGAILARGGDVSFEQIAFRGFSNPLTAGRALERALRALSFPLGAAKLRATRVAWALRPADLAVLTSEKYGITGMVVRVTDARPGTLTEGRIELDVVEDIFSTGISAADPAEGDIPGDPIGPVADLLSATIQEAPYEFVRQLVPGPEQQPRGLIVAAGGAGITEGYLAHLRKPDDSGWFAAVEVPRLTPVGSLTARISKLATSLTVTGLYGMEQLVEPGPADVAGGRALLLVDTELIAWQTITDNGNGTWTIGGLIRGDVDTTPTPHAQGSLVWFVSEGYGILGLNAPEWPATLLNNRVRLQPFNVRGPYDFASLGDRTVPVADVARGFRPSCPTAVLLNGVAYPNSISGELTVSWQHRNRLATWSHADAGRTIDPEAGVTYRVTVWGQNDTVVRVQSGIVGNSWTYPEVDEEAESGTGLLNTKLRVLVHAVRGGVESWLAFDHSCTRV